MTITCLALSACSTDNDDSPDAGAPDAGTGGSGSRAGSGGMGEPSVDPLAPPAPDYWPTEAWEEATPESVGLQSGALEEAVAFALESNTQALAIIKDGYLVSETYARGFTQTQRHESFSMAKSFTSALVGIAVAQGHLSGVHARLCNFYAAWDCDDRDDPRGRIRLAHVMNLISGLDWNESWGEGSSFANNDAIVMSSSSRPIDYVLAKPTAHEPGEVFQYSTGDPALLSGVLQSATGSTALEYAREHLLEPIGARSVQWAADADGQTRTFAGMEATLHDYARFGFLYLHRGRWDGTQIIPASWVAESTDPATDASAGAKSEWYTRLWHVNLPARYEDPELPADAYAAMGVSGQYILMLPSENLMIVRLADDSLFGAEFDMPGLIQRVLAAKEGGS